MNREYCDPECEKEGDGKGFVGEGKGDSYLLWNFLIDERLKECDDEGLIGECFGGHLRLKGERKRKDQGLRIRERDGLTSERDEWGK